MPNPSDRPNIVLFLPDQWRGDCLGSLGHPAVETPFLDELAAVGTTFTSAYTPAPSCVPARACLATGRSPAGCARLGMVERLPWRYDRTLMTCLRDGGYQTMLAGKTHFYPQMTTLGFEKMLQYEAKVLGDAPECDYHAWLERETRGLVHDTGSDITRNGWVVRPWTEPEYLHPTTWTMTAALDLLTRRDPLRPFFIQIAPNRPHPPLDPPVEYFHRFVDRELEPVPVGEWAAEFDYPPPATDSPRGRIPGALLDRARRAYYAQLAHIDYQVGRLVHFLGQNGLAGNTIIIFSSDHGELLGDHHMFRKVIPLEGSARVPLVVAPARGRGRSAGRRCEAPVTLADFMPTILELAGLDVPDEVEGRSFAGFLDGGRPEWREFIHGEHAGGSEGWQFVTDGREKFIWESKSGREWFFDLARDPGEETNLADDPEAADRIEPWRRRLAEILAERPEDKLSDGERLLAGKVIDPTRPWLKEQ